MTNSGRTYSIIRSERVKNQTVEAIVETGLAGYPAADRRRNTLQAKEDAAHPERSSWTKVLFIVQLENVDAKS